MNKVLERNQVEDKYKWSITDLFESDKAWQEAYHNVEQSLVKLDKYKNNITVENLADCLKLRDSIMILGERVCVYEA